MNGTSRPTNGLPQPTPSRPVSVYDNLNRQQSNHSLNRHSYDDSPKHQTSSLINQSCQSVSKSNPGTLQRQNADTLRRSNTDTLQRRNNDACNDTLQRHNTDTLRRSNTATSQRSNNVTLAGCDEDTNGDVSMKKLLPEGARSPTQEHLLRTTVPQRIIGSNVGERHTPTRNSLRHSRMIVMHKTVPRKSLPPIIRYHKLAKALVTLKTLLGFGLCLFALWLLFWTPNMRSRDNPYWSALPLLLSGIFGIILICSCKKEYPKIPGGYCVYSIKVLSVFLSTISSATCFIAATFAFIHLISILTTTCEPLSKLNSTCVCQSPVKPTNDTTTLNYHALLPFVPKIYHYVDLTCEEVGHMLVYLVIVSAVVNVIGGVLAMWYVYLHWASRYYYTYSKVRTQELRPIVIRNS